MEKHQKRVNIQDVQTGSFRLQAYLNVRSAMSRNSCIEYAKSVATITAGKQYWFRIKKINKAEQDSIVSIFTFLFKKHRLSENNYIL